MWKVRVCLTKDNQDVFVTCIVRARLEKAARLKVQEHYGFEFRGICGAIQMPDVIEILD